MYAVLHDTRQMQWHILSRKKSHSGKPPPSKGLATLTGTCTAACHQYQGVALRDMLMVGQARISVINCTGAHPDMVLTESNVFLIRPLIENNEGLS